MARRGRTSTRTPTTTATRAFGERLHALDLDDAARKRLGGSVIVTRDGPHIFLYAWHEESAREAERVVRELMESDGLAGEVQLTRWHPAEEAWRPADEPLPETDAERQAEDGPDGARPDRRRASTPGRSSSTCRTSARPASSPTS